MRRTRVSSLTLTLLLTAGLVVTAQEADEAPPAGSFESAGSLVKARSGHTATLLPDGRVLVTGGDGLEPEELATAEVWDPVTSMWGSADELAEALSEPAVEADIERTGHTATLLPDGRALLVGGYDSDDPVAITAAEILDPASGELVAAGTLLDARSGHTATFLRDGRVLIVGGSGLEGPLATAEVWIAAQEPARCLGKRPTLIAQPGVELIGTPGNDVISGSVGSDIIHAGAGAGDDRICGNAGDDAIDGGSGRDRIDAGPGADMVSGGDGRDRLLGGRGDDTLDGGEGVDVCDGGKGHDALPGCNDRRRTRGTLRVTRSTTLKGPHNGNIVIASDGVRLDCGGHTVRGPGIGKRRVEFGFGIHVPFRRRVTITDCHATNFNVGIRIHASSRINVRHSSANENGAGVVIAGAERVVVTDSAASRNATPDGPGTGFASSDAPRVRLERNRADDNGIGFGIWDSNRNVLRMNSAGGNTRAGYELVNASRNRLSNNTSANGGTGFLVNESDRNTFESNSTSATGGAGFALYATSDDNVLNDNTATDAERDEPGFFVGGAGNQLTGNIADENGGQGIHDFSAPGANRYSENLCQGNRLAASEPPGLCSAAKRDDPPAEPDA